MTTDNPLAFISVRGNHVHHVEKGRSRKINTLKYKLKSFSYSLIKKKKRKTGSFGPL